MLARQTDIAIRKSAHLLVSQGHKKRSGIPIAPLETESAAGRDEAKRLPPSPMRADCRGCRERFPRKDPGVFDLLGSSLSCDTTGLTPPNKHLCLRVAEPLGRPVLASEEMRAPGRNYVLPHTTNPIETRFSLEVLAVDAPRRHSKRVTIFQLSNPRESNASDTASRFFSRNAPVRRLRRFPTLPPKMPTHEEGRELPAPWHLTPS